MLKHKQNLEIDREKDKIMGYTTPRTSKDVDIDVTKYVQFGTWSRIEIHLSVINILKIKEIQQSNKKL